ncbi:putative bifunctional diguanylate cyclase/phosphodiesterase [Hansschlegelia zhihuaiae]|uniref:EAL domain-containing protein n=1 Tax=Hansschlegelia zhihuaiae TaxID=405005 RepID=A0A4Q0M6B6_9HYPH|nr:EAL domain-containing protein [Hansschlegelia zhihuaiae]RXF68524.1 EAL domain-containing protein [Hansschlegelia zhihuaiae]
MRIAEASFGGVRSRSVVALGLAMAMSVTVLSAGLIVWRYGEVIEQSKSDLSNVAALLATQSTHAFQAIDVTQTQLIDALGAAGIRSAEDVRVRGGDRQLHDELKQLVRSIDILDAMSIIDAGGRLVNFSRGWPIPDVTVSDRDYFKALSAPGGSTYWSKPVRNRGNGEWTVYRARRLPGADGRFVGLVLGMVSVSKLEQHYASIALPVGSSIALYRDDGALLVRNPTASRDDALASPRVAEIARELTTRGGGAVFDEAGKNSVDLITAVAKLSDYPLVIAASSPRDAVLRGWRREAAAIGTLAILLDLTIALAGLLGLRQLHASDQAFRAEQHSARHDVLTGLPNRTYLKQRLDETFLRTSSSSSFALLLIDLDGFKEVNASFGHAAGDELLKIVAGRFRGVLGSCDFLARLGGDEFAVVHVRGEGALDVLALAEELRQSLSAPVRLQEAQVQVSCSVGAATARKDGAEAAQLLAHADLALFRAKESGRNAVREYSDDMGADRKERLSLLRDLRAAADASELMAFFQPIVDLRTREIMGFEALLRWRHATRGFVSPGQFIPLAEESGLISRIGAWVLNEACQRAAGWPGEFKVAVNLSPAQLRIQDVFSQIYSALQNSGLPASRLVLEITESVQLDQTHAGQTLRALRDLGVGVSLDDFGTGYASLSYLRSFPFDAIKIDQSFVRDIHRSEESQIIVQTVLAMAGRLGMSVVAEGVETFEQLETLIAEGCAKGQGHLFGAPMPAAEVAGFVAQWKYPTRGGRSRFTLVS